MQNQDFFQLSAYPATWIDNLLIDSPKFGRYDSAKDFGCRGLSLLISQTVLPIFVGFDLVANTARSLSYHVAAKISGDKRYAELANRADSLAMKCLRALPFTLLGIFWRDAISNHFLPEAAPKGTIQPKGRLYEAKAEVIHARSVDTVQGAVKRACREGKSISIAGAGFCQGKQTLPPEELQNQIHLNMRGVNHIEIDPNTKIAKVGAGATWQQIQEKANEHGLAVQVAQASNVFSIGGSLSADCHGWDHKQGSLSNTVHAITIIDANGEMKRLTPEDQHFRYIAGGYGMFGVMVEVELELTENRELFDCSEKVEIDNYVSHFRKDVEANPDIHMHLYRLGLEPGKLLQEGWSQSYYKKSQNGDRARLVDEPPKGTMMDKILIQVARNSTWARSYYWRGEVEKMKQPKYTTRNEVMRPPINAVFATNSRARTEWLQEYYLPEDKLADFVKFLGEKLDQNDVALMNASVRYVRKQERAAMGYATKGDRFAVVLFFSQSLNPNEIKKTEKWVQEVVERVADDGGTFYLPYMHFATKEQFNRCYPQANEIRAAKEKFDPNNRFQNGLQKDYLS